jgi:hypothetical protein
LGIPFYTGATQELCHGKDAMDKGRIELLGPIESIETFAAGRGIWDLARLRKDYGLGFWRKCKGVAIVRHPDGQKYLAELHWYEASGIGRREMKVKRVLKLL